MLADATGNSLRLPLTPFDFGHSGTEAYFPYPIEPEEVYITPTGKLVEIDESQAWFWTEEWQAGERKVEEYIREGNVQTFDTIEEFLRTLRE